MLSIDEFKRTFKSASVEVIDTFNGLRMTRISLGSVTLVVLSRNDGTVVDITNGDEIPDWY